MMMSDVNPFDYRTIGWQITIKKILNNSAPKFRAMLEKRWLGAAKGLHVNSPIGLTLKL